MVKEANAGHSQRIATVDYGIDLPAILEAIKPHLEHMTNAQVGERAGLSARVISKT